VADYKQWAQSLDGVGAVKVYPVWAGGGTVKVVFLDSSYQIPSGDLVDRVQTAIDPETNHGQGIGLAPIGHTVTVKAADAHVINVQTTLTLDSGVTIGQFASVIKESLIDLLLDLKKGWAEQSIIVRIAHIDARLLNIAGVVDVRGTTLNGQGDNISLAEEAVPELGEVIINGQTI